MHVVAALDTVPQMCGVLALFEGVATGAADGYARIANLHNGRRTRVPMVVVVGDHVTYHKKYDAPLESDIETFPPGKPLHTCLISVGLLGRSPTRQIDTNDVRGSHPVSGQRRSQRALLWRTKPAEVYWS